VGDFFLKHHCLLRRLILWGAFLAVVYSLYGCKENSATLELAHLLPMVEESATIKGVPSLTEDDHSFGPSALVTLVKYHGGSIAYSEAVRMVHTPRHKGPYKEELMLALQRLGYITSPINSFEALYKEVTAQNPVIILQNTRLALLPKWRYSVVSGYRLARRQILLNDGGAQPHWTATDILKDTWQKAGNWGVVAVKPGQLPASADDAEISRALGALVQSGLYDEATLSYQTLIEKRPESPAGYVGLGNLEMLRKNYAAAEGHFRDAMTIKPDDAQATEGMAYSLYAQQKNDSACDILRPYEEAHKNPLQNIYYQMCVYQTR